MPTTAFTRIRTCALAIAAVFCISSQALAQPQGGPNVTVVNTPLPVTVTNQAIPGTPVAFIVKSSTPFMVPPGQRLVIEYVSGTCQGPRDVAFDVTTGGVTNVFLVALPSAVFSPLVQFGHLVKVYADPETNVTLESSASGFACALSFSGLLVNTP
jgi:hypothetical protein